MARTRFFEHVHDLLRLALRLDSRGIAARDGLAQWREAQHQAPRSPRRRHALQAMSGLGLGLTGMLGAARITHAGPPANGIDVAVVGAGLAGLRAATLLQAKRARVRVFEAGDRVGGRVWSLRGVFPGQVAERGAELIDTGHVTLRGLARSFGLTLESYAPSQLPGDDAFYFFGLHWSEAQVLEEFCAFAPAIRDDIARLSNEPSAFENTAYDRELDRMPLSQYLQSRGAGNLIRAVLDVAYTIEFGRDIERQSALALVFYISPNCGRKFKPFGSSDERFHIVEGNDAVPSAMAATLADPVRLGHRLVAVDTQADGRVRLAFDTPGGMRESTHDAAILTLPAPLVRTIAFGPGVVLPPGYRNAIDQFDYGTNSKLMIGFRGRPWWEASGSNGGSFSDLPNLQATWETNPSLARNGMRGVLTDFSGGERGARLDPSATQREAEAFLGDLEQVYPGSQGLARRDAAGRIVAHLENWSRLPNFMGAYSNNIPGYFTTIEGWYSQPVGRIHFAGEHTDSFYNYQGFMEGALASGARAADAVLKGG